MRSSIGAGTINLGAGTGDTINLTSTSADLNTLGATNASIQGVEAISAASAAAGVTITLSGQTEAFAITGSAQADTITGGDGRRHDRGGRRRRHDQPGQRPVRRRRVDPGRGQQRQRHRDQIVLTNGTTVDFIVGTVTGIETLTGSSGNDTVTMTASQLAGFGTDQSRRRHGRAERRRQRRHLGACACRR